MQRFWKEFPAEYIIWLGAFVSIVGFLSTVDKHRWWACCFVLAFAATAYGFCRRADSERNQAIKAKEMADDERSKAEKRSAEAADRLNRTATKYVERIDAALAWHTMAQAVGNIEWTFEVASRLVLLKLQMDEFRVLSLRSAGETVYVVAEAAAPILQHLKRHDPFLLVAITAGGVEHVVAKLRVDQLGNVKGCVVFAVTEIRDDTFNKLVDLAGMSDLDLTKGYRVRLPAGIKEFEDLNLAAVKDGIAVVKEAMLSDAKGVETWKL